VQAVGRALRRDPNNPNKIGYVLLPVVVPDDQTVAQFLESGAFKEIGRVLATLSIHDDRIAEEFRISDSGEIAKGSESRILVMGDMPVSVSEMVSASEFAKQCRAKMWEKVGRLNWRPFEEAREFARGLKLNGTTEWNNYCARKIPQLGNLPNDIPSNPHRTYATQGWNGMGDWLGTGRIATWLRNYRSFHDARRFVRKLKLKGNAEWRLYCQGQMPNLGVLPEDIPANPDQTYPTHWIGYGDWIGTGTIAPFLRKFRSFEQARAFARSLNLTSQSKWKVFCQGKMPKLGKLPADIPSNPNRTYVGTGWKTVGDWLGTDKIADQFKKYRSFSEARIFVHKLKLKSRTEWEQFCHGKLPILGKLPSDIPIAPNNTYAAKGWNGMGDWLGTGTVAPRFRNYRSFDDARAFVRTLKLKGNTEWRLYCKGEMPNLGVLPKDIPAAPDRIYLRKGWIGYGDWIGTGTIAPFLRKFRSFEQARAFARSLKLKGQKDWISFTKGKLPELGRLPLDIPVTPCNTYANKGWINVGDWLGTGYISTRQRKYRSFTKARKFAHGLKLTSSTEWINFCHNKKPNLGKLPTDIPTNPNSTYAHKGWKGFGDWLGTGTVSPSQRIYRSFQQARAFIRSLKLKNNMKWRAYCTGKLTHFGKLPSDIPAAPERTYRDQGWISYGDWLGTGTVSLRLRKYQSFEEARNFVRSLKLKSGAEWINFRKGKYPKLGTLPLDIPNKPEHHYANKGWKGMKDWLGTND
jgi:hypothetical protein